jgi:glycosyltransferase involved in cell wall biosynthesis
MPGPDDDYDYEPRSPGEIAALEDSFRGSMNAGMGARNYVAKPAPGYDVHGLWHSFGAGHRSGYATHAMALHWLITMGLKIPMQLVPHRNMDIDIDEFPSDRYDTLFEWHKAAVGYPHAMIVSFPPEVAAEMDGVGPPLVPYCAFEGDRTSAYMRELCNGDAFRSVWVVSEFVKKAMVAGGVEEEKVEVVRPPVCDGPWSMPLALNLEMNKQRPVTPDDPYTFGAMGTWHARKGFPDLLRAYFGAFKREDPVKLEIRTSAFGENLTIREMKERLTKEIAAIAAEFGDDNFPASQKQPHLKLILGTEATDQEVIEWLASLDCYANATYGEGLGIPHIWAKANGVPMVSSKFGAVGEMVGNLLDNGSLDCVYPHRLAPVDEEMPRIALMFDRESKWGVYEPSALGDAMQYQWEAGRRLDEKSIDVVRDRFSIKSCIPAARDALWGLLDAEWIEKWAI